MKAKPTQIDMFGDDAPRQTAPAVKPDRTAAPAAPRPRPRGDRRGSDTPSQPRWGSWRDGKPKLK